MSNKIFHSQSRNSILEKVAPNSTAAIRDLVSVPLPLYQTLYGETLCRFAELCQSITAEDKTSAESLLKQHLTQCIRALKLRRQYLLPLHAECETIAAQEPRWTYAVFLVGLLQGLPCLLDKNTIETRIATLLTPAVQQWLKPLLPVCEKALLIPTLTNPLTAIITKAMATHLPTEPIAPKEPISVVVDDAALASSKATINNVEVEIESKSKSESESEHEPQLKPVTLSESLQKLLDFLAIYYDKVTFRKKTRMDVLQPAGWLRVAEGLFISHVALQHFLSAQTESTQNQNEFLAHHADFLVRHPTNGYQHTFRSRKVHDKRLLEGVIIQADFLPKKWQQQPINSIFQPTIL